ncbi:hypothetical protein BTA51_11355 [Hahella sp. CCB-MM4]|uniref:7-cyano-7-deazaguanine synthase n=1 Tax=Hahella sp. (strain CCB-MM4) TaxID=1926491 RepID=UPI000B9BEC77|nr:7-cyano-7-deazaguanine synthase [Hahella sp. CCB-MM4]OZG73087.1 hypothetical protein BTA51_11355 [Hahella sp. CCB-MM4]
MTFLSSPENSSNSLTVDVVEPHNTLLPTSAVACEINNHIQFNPEILETYCAKNLESIVYDLLITTAAIEFSDRYKPRSRVKWPRDIQLRIPVADPSHWSSPSVSDSLRKTLNVLTGDHWRLYFVQRSSKYTEAVQSQLDYPPNASAIMAYSDGLDSRSVASIFEDSEGKDTLIKVRVGSSDKQNGKPAAFTAIPFTVKYPKHHHKEDSFRSRGFKFAAISAIAAYLSKTKNIIVPESGQGALSPVLLPLHAQYPDFRNHPVFFRKMESFIYALLGYSLNYSQPRIWFTKGETVFSALNTGIPEDVLKDTRSCWQSRYNVSFGGIRHQCGACAACLLRRLSLNHAEIEESENTYYWSNLSSSSFEKAAPDSLSTRKGFKTMKANAVAGVRHFDELANLVKDSNTRFLLAHSLELAKSTNQKHEDVHIRLTEMLKKHSHEWHEFLNSLKDKSFINNWIQGVIR